MLGEIARGETVGEMAFFTGEPRTATVTAIRGSVLARFSNTVFRELLLAYPLVSLNMTRQVIERFKRVNSGRKAPTKPVIIGVLGISRNVDTIAFAQSLTQHLCGHGQATVVTSQHMDTQLGEPGAAQASRADVERSRRVTVRLDKIEAQHDFVVFVADEQRSEWTQRCIRHRNELLLLADADEPPTLHPNEVDLHTQGGAGEAQEVQVLSGGGARRFAHLGVMRAMEEAGIGVDMVAGTSIGAVMAAYAGMDIPAQEMIDAARTAFRENPTGGYNMVPLMSLISGKRLRRVIDSAVVDSRGQHIDIEDLWKDYFCVTSNYSAAREAVHTRGPLAKSIRASASIPGALPPVMLHGELHIDGGTFNNFPTDVMARRGAARIIGVDLLRDRGLRYELDEVPSALELIRDKLRGRARRYRLPLLTSLLLNTSLMYSYARQQEALSVLDLHFAPAVYSFGMLEWSKFDKIVDAGYRHGVAQLEKMGDAAIAPYRYA